LTKLLEVTGLIAKLVLLEHWHLKRPLVVTHVVEYFANRRIRNFVICFTVSKHEY